MTPMQVGFRQPSPGVVGLEGDQSGWICYHGTVVEIDVGVHIDNRKPRLSNTSEDEVDYDKTPVRKTNVAPTRSVPTRAA